LQQPLQQLLRLVGLFGELQQGAVLLDQVDALPGHRRPPGCIDKRQVSTIRGDQADERVSDPRSAQGAAPAPPPVSVIVEPTATSWSRTGCGPSAEWGRRGKTRQRPIRRT